MKPKSKVASWARAESEKATCGDARLNHRLGVLLTAMGEAPGASIPQACGGQHAEMAAAYRFFDNEATTPANILAAHTQQSLERIAAHPTVLLVQDTTEVDMSQPQRRISGAGPLDDSPRQGALLHLMHAFTPEGTPLGSVWHKVLIRAPRPASQSPAAARKTRSQRQNTPLEAKESVRWIEGLTAANVMALAQPRVRHICIADSEADIYEYLHLLPPTTPEAPAQQGAHWIVRACQDRTLLASAATEASKTTAAASLWATCRAAPVLWSKPLHVRGRQGKIACDKRARRQPRTDRDIIVEARAASQITLRAPYRKGQTLAAVKLNAVLVSEVDPPAGDVPVEWLLLTSLPVASAGDVRQIVEAYSQRFKIEVLFRTLKSGCRIEARRFESAERHLSHLALALIIAWRVLWLSQLAQNEPERDAEEIFTTSEWQAAWAVVKRGEPLPSKPPSAGEMIKLVGKLGGWIERRGRHASPPGVQTLWQGLSRLHDLAAVWNICHQWLMCNNEGQPPGSVSTRSLRSGSTLRRCSAAP